MTDKPAGKLADTGERMIPPKEGEVSVVFSRHKFVYQYATQFAAKKHILDMGCGTGYGCKMLADHAEQVTGIDFNSDAITYCKTHYNAPNINYVHSDISSFSAEKEFDMAVSFQVIEHVKDTQFFIEHMKKLVKPGGLILITTPNANKTVNENEGNPFHFSEMSHNEFDHLLKNHFNSYKLIGIGDASPNRLRSLAQKIPFYKQIGLLLKRGSKIKKAASKALDLTNFRIVEEQVAKNSVDLLAVCENDAENH